MKAAISLKYPENADAPFITSKSSGAIAERMIEIAKENDIPVVENDILANVLSLHEIGTCIPESTWKAVASIFAVIGESERER
ncbi:MAG: EscU/YscU/HrcU family type III secretion system export apparatus switch protein [Treponema sp.]|nr:EscU/YscU/HrcU family type III secretion system export apparatus switch protein [Treponema sp.]